MQTIGETAVTASTLFGGECDEVDSPREDIEESKEVSFEIINPQDNPKKKRIRKRKEKKAK